MTDLLSSLCPVLLLIFFGYLLQRRKYFRDETVQQLTSFVSGILVPCVLFNTFLNLNFRMEYIWLAVSFFILLVILLAAGFLLNRFFPMKRRFYPLFFCCFAFGFMAIPLFSTVFGIEKMDYLAAIGIGHELFVGLIFMSTAQLWLKNEPVSSKTIVRTFTSPLMMMVAAALIIRALGIKDMLYATLIGRSIFDMISRLAGITTTLIMIVVGYRIRFDSLSRIKESVLLVLARYALTFGIGYLYKFLVMDRFAGGNIYFDYAFFTLLSQHGSVLLVAYVGDYGSREDLEIISNSLVVNEIIGIILFLIFISSISALPV